jgi:hypothetical protein
MRGETRTLECVAFGVEFRLAAESDELLAKMRLCAPLGTEVGVCADAEAMEFAVFQDGMGAGYRLVIDGEGVGEAAPLEDILEQLARDLMVHVADAAPERVFVHAGVVGWKERVVVMPGMSFAGKTTLVAELVRAGAAYYSDEYAVIDVCGRVHPYARELQMREMGSTEQRGVSVAELGGVAAKESGRVSHVVFAEYECGARWEPATISRGKAALEMMRHAIAVQRAPERVMATLAKMMETAEAMRGVRGEASEVVRWMLDAVSA